MSHSLSYLESAQQLWPAARREAWLSAFFGPLTRDPLFPGLYLGAIGAAFGVPILGLWLLGLPLLGAAAVVVPVIVGGWALLTWLLYDRLGQEGVAGQRVREEMLSGAQLYFEETGESIWVGGDPADASLRQLPDLLEQTLRARQ